MHILESSRENIVYWFGEASQQFMFQLNCDGKICTRFQSRESRAGHGLHLLICICDVYAWSTKEKK